MSFQISIKDALRQSVEAQTGGLVTVLYDDLGQPSFMRVIPKFSYEDLGYSAQLGTGVCTAFLVGGVEKPYIMVGQYLASVHGARAVSLPGVDPQTSVTFDQARSYCADKGAGWHLMTAHEWAAVAFWCMANGYQPKGNTQYGRAHDATHQVARRVDGGRPGVTSGTARTLTGSGPMAWRHDNGPAGIADLVGNVEEWQDGIKVLDGRIVCTVDNEYGLAEGAWPGQAAYFDSPVAGDGVGTDNLGSPLLAAAVTQYAGPMGNSGSFDYNQASLWAGMVTAGSYVPNPLMKRLLLEPAGVSPAGYVIGRNYGERPVVRGGPNQLTTYCGFGALKFFNVRSHVSSARGFRPAYVP